MNVIAANFFSNQFPGPAVSKMKRVHENARAQEMYFVFYFCMKTWSEVFFPTDTLK